MGLFCNLIGSACLQQRQLCLVMESNDSVYSINGCLSTNSFLMASLRAQPGRVTGSWDPADEQIRKKKGRRLAGRFFFFFFAAVKGRKS